MNPELQFKILQTYGDIKVIHYRQGEFMTTCQGESFYRQGSPAPTRYRSIIRVYNIIYEMMERKVIFIETGTHE